MKLSLPLIPIYRSREAWYRTAYSFSNPLMKSNTFFGRFSVKLMVTRASASREAGVSRVNTLYPPALYSSVDGRAQMPTTV